MDKLVKFPGDFKPCPSHSGIVVKTDSIIFMKPLDKPKK